MLHRIGYWAHARAPLPDPSLHVDLDPAADDLDDVAEYLERGFVVARFMGPSLCRICGCRNGANDLSDGVFIWPQGLSHYLAVHSVKLPAPIVSAIRDRIAALDRAYEASSRPAYEESLSLWRRSTIDALPANAADPRSDAAEHVARADPDETR